MRDTPNLKILLCESNIRILARLESWIKALGGELMSSSDGISALQIFKEYTPDILLVSQDLNSMGGIELIEEVKKIVPNQAVVMMLSENDTVFKRAIDLKVDKYLNKPVEASALFSTIEMLLEEKLWHKEYVTQKKLLQDFKDAIDFSFSVSKHDKDGKLTYVNNLFCISTKLTYEEAMSGVINPLCNPQEDMERVWSILKKDGIYKGRQHFTLSDGSEKIIDVTAVTQLNEIDESYKYLVFTDDVTKIVHAAREIKNQELDRRLEKINHAKELSKVKDSFLTIFTHELKTPLNSIINFSEYVTKHLQKENFEKKDKLLQYVREINSSGIFMFHMITNLMEAMKLKDSKLKLNITKLDLNLTLNSLLLSSFKTDNKKIVNENNEELILFSDEERLIQVLEHLISNALKYSKKQVSIFMSTDEDSFTLEIADDGEGFIDKSNVFDLFEQSDSESLTRKGVGVGIGLFIVKQLCDRMGYEIRILDSDLLGGARVLIKGKRKLAK